MLSASKAQRACAKCRTQLLSMVENLLSPSTNPTTAPRPRRLAPAFRSARYSSTRSGSREVATGTHPLDKSIPSDIELIVRQTKRQFGDTLPNNYLNEDELKLYTRLYGAPLRETRPEDVGMPIDQALLEETHKYIFVKNKNALLKEKDNGELEEIPYQVHQAAEERTGAEGEQSMDVATTSVSDSSTEEPTGPEFPSDAGVDYIKVVAKNQREFDALLKLQKDFETATLIDVEEQRQREEDVAKEMRELAEEAAKPLPMEEEHVFEEQEEEEEEEELDEIDAEFRARSVRFHKLTRLGRWSDQMKTIYLPKADFVNPITTLLNRTDIKHVREAAEKVFGGPGLPYSVATPSWGRSGGSTPVKLEAGHHRMTPINADVFMATNLPTMYASIMSILVEVRKRMGPQWIQGLMARNDGEGSRVLDIGSAGAGLVSWDRVLQTEWELLHGDAAATLKRAPMGKRTVVVGNENLRQRVSQLLHNTTFLPRLPDYLHSGKHPEKMDDSQTPPSRKKYDVIIASHSLMPLTTAWKRKIFIDNLWELLEPEGGVLIILEKGHPRGFEAVADVRHRLVHDFIEAPTSDPQPEPKDPSQPRRIRESGMIIAPCTNHKKCPMYLEPGLALGRKDFCHFKQRFVRPNFLQLIHHAKHHNYEDVEFSFLAVQRGVTPTSPPAVPSPPPGQETAMSAAFSGYENSDTPPNPLSLPRNIMPPLKRSGHVTMDVCTPAGTMERWIVTRGQSRQAFHDARKARWGDLWALGAKTRTERRVRLGRGGVSPQDGGVRARRAEALAKGSGVRVVNMETDAAGMFNVNEKGVGSGNGLGGRGHAFVERRTKGGKKLMQRKKRMMPGDYHSEVGEEDGSKEKD